MLDYSTHSDQQLMDLLRANDERAFTELYDRYWDKLFVVASSKLNNPLEAEEIVQDIFLDIWKRRADLKITEASVKTYLAVAVKYRVINFLVKRDREKEYKLHVSRQAALDHTTQNQLSFEELKDRLAKHVADLPKKCRIVFQLSREEGLSQKEIASKTGISEKTVERHISRALQSLRTHLQNLFSFFL